MSDMSNLKSVIAGAIDEYGVMAAVGILCVAAIGALALLSWSVKTILLALVCGVAGGIAIYVVIAYGFAKAWSRR